MPRERPGVIAAKGAQPVRLTTAGRVMNRSGARPFETPAPLENEGLPRAAAAPLNRIEPRRRRHDGGVERKERDLSCPPALPVPTRRPILNRILGCAPACPRCGFVRGAVRTRTYTVDRRRLAAPRFFPRPIRFGTRPRREVRKEC
ncbi:MAG: hypothetical protein OHK0044_00300 [Burkholderiaceae bacterium]